MAFHLPCRIQLVSSKSQWPFTCNLFQSFTYLTASRVGCWLRSQSYRCHMQGVEDCLQASKNVSCGGCDSVTSYPLSIKSLLPPFYPHVISFTMQALLSFNISCIGPNEASNFNDYSSCNNLHTYMQFLAAKSL